MLVYKSNVTDLFGDELFLINDLLFNKLKDFYISKLFKSYISSKTNRMYQDVKSIYMLSFNIYHDPFVNKIHSKELLTKYFNTKSINYKDFVHSQFNCMNKVDSFTTWGTLIKDIQELFLADQDLNFPFPHCIFTVYQNKFYDKYMMIHFYNELECNEGFILINLK